MKQRTICFENFEAEMRGAVLASLDAFMRDTAASDNTRGWKDSDLKFLIPAIEAHARRVAERFNADESTEIGSAHLYIHV